MLPVVTERPRGRATWGRLTQVGGAGTYDDRAVDQLLRRRPRGLVTRHERQHALDP